MSTVFRQMVTDRSAWRGCELAGDSAWIDVLSPQALNEIDAALCAVRSAGLDLERIGRVQFPLPSLGPRLRAHLDEIQHGRGFVVLRGLPVERYSDEEVGLIFWGLGRHLGVPVAQNPQGDLLGHVFDHGRAYGQIDVRGYETNAHLPFHTNACDLVGLLCLRKARRGGLSSIVSAITLHNEILRRHPEYLPPLYKGFHYIKREAALTDSPVTERRIPVFAHEGGLISCRYIRNQINAACEKTGRPLDNLERQALDFLDALSQDPALHLDMDLQPGDMQFCNNYTILHSRTGFEDWPEPGRERHMLRLWLTCRERRPLASGFPQHNGYRQLSEVAYQL
ncbi:MAG TPA: TauD/TfdA family dioxygenase [Alphaproteobacteria bacterium]|nr:TauD/TfdA family dioxygenase [Alphaproteobacteria bacterium]